MSTFRPSTEFERAFDLLEALRRLIESAGEDLEDNPLVREIRLYEFLWELGTGDLELDEEIWDALEQFIACDDGPLLDLIRSSEDRANAVLRLVNFIYRLIQAFLRDQIDEAFADAIKNAPGFRRALLEALKLLLKAQIPQIRKEIDAGNLERAARLVADLKSGDWVEGPLQVILDAIREAIEDAVAEAGAAGGRFVLRLVLQRLLGSAVPAEAALLILEDLFWFAEAVEDVIDLHDAHDRWNRAMLRVVELGRESEEVPCFETGENVTFLWWNFEDERFESVHVEYYLRCWCEEEEEWKEMPLEVRSGGQTGTGTTVTPTGEEGEFKLGLEVPPPEKRPCPGPCYIVARVDAIDEAGLEISTLFFVGVVCD